MKLQEIQLEWENDAKIDPLILGDESIRIPILHAKYLNILSSKKLQLRKAEADYLRLRNVKGRYYRGQMSGEELEELEWTQYLGPKLLKADVNDAVESDEDVIKQIDKVEYYKTVVFQLEHILKSLSSRSFDIKNAITWQQWTNGNG